MNELARMYINLCGYNNAMFSVNRLDEMGIIMLTSELIEYLETLKKEHGDLPVFHNADQGNPWKEIKGGIVFACANSDYPLTVYLS